MTDKAKEQGQPFGELTPQQFGELMEFEKLLEAQTRGQTPDAQMLQGSLVTGVYCGVKQKMTRAAFLAECEVQWARWEEYEEAKRALVALRNRRQKK